MIARQAVWSNPEIQDLLKHFVPAADEVWSLQHREDPEARLFQKVAEQGHYKGRTYPTDTRQGTYATAPSGVLLASINSNQPEAMAAMLRRALVRWKELPDSEKWLEGDLPENVAKGRPETFYPEDGLVLRETVRDLPRVFAAEDWRTQAWNKDFVWFRKDEARSLLPEKLASGEEAAVPSSLVMRLATLNLIDTVRGQASRYVPADISRAELRAKVISVKGAKVEVRFDGLAKANREGKWPIAGDRDSGNPTEQKRGYELTLGGVATYDTAKGRFTAFSLVAAGTRWGATQYNGRRDDLGPAPIGYLFELASGEPHDRVPPSEFGAYGWR